MSLRKKVQRLCQNADCKGWVFVYEDDETGGYSVAGEPKLLADMMLTVANLNGDLLRSLIIISSRFNQQPHAASGVRAKHMPEPRKAK